MPRTIALIYLAFGAVWIFFTDRLLVWLHLDADLILRLQTAKGWLFVIGSAVLLYVLLRRYERRGGDAMAALIQSRNEVRKANADLERRVAERTRQLEAANRELEAFAYAVSHDLRAPLRSMSGFSQILQDTAPAGLDEKSRHYLQRIQDASLRMSGLIEDLLNLSRIGRSELTARPISLGQIAGEAAASMRERHPGREVQLEIAPGMDVNADPRLLRIALENLLSNAWKYTARASQAQVTVGTHAGETRSGLFRSRQRRRLRHEVRGQAVRAVPAAASRNGISRQRHRAGDGPAHHRAARRAHLGGRKAG